MSTAEPRPESPPADPPRDPAEPSVHARRGLVDWGRTGRRMLRSAAVLVVLAVILWGAVGLAGSGLDPAQLGDYLGLAVAGMVVVEIVVVGGSALRGLLRAGEQGERLAGGDVSLLPPQLTDGAAAPRPEAASEMHPGPDDVPGGD